MSNDTTKIGQRWRAFAKKGKKKKDWRQLPRQVVGTVHWLEQRPRTIVKCNNITGLRSQRLHGLS